MMCASLRAISWLAEVGPGSTLGGLLSKEVSGERFWPRLTSMGDAA